MHFPSGQLEQGFVIGGYRVDELISRGGMGSVYRVTNIALNRIYALKVLAPELSGDDQFRDRFKREMRIAASLHHDHVVGIHYAGEQDGLLFLVMDFVYGTDLRQLLKRSGALAPERAVDLLGQIASALDVAHHRGLVHRDVKPGNILITVHDGEEHAYLTDFGLAKRSDTVGALTQKGVVVGTVDYMAPEQVTGGLTDARTDVYALGCVFFQMLTGSVPYDRDNSVATLFAHVHEPPPPLDGRLMNAYPAFCDVVDTAMAKVPSERYLSAGDFARDAAAALRGTRYTGPPSLVATGEAKPSDLPVPGDEDLAATDADRSDRLGPPIGAGSQPPRWPGPEPPIGPVSQPPAHPASQPSPWPGPQQPSPHGMEPPEWPRFAPEAPAAWGPPAPAPDSGGGGIAPGPPQPPPKTASDGGRRSRRNYAWLALAAVVVAAGVAVIIALSTGPSGRPASASGHSASSASAGAKAPPGETFTATLNSVPHNRVNGGGTASVVLNGNVATVKVTTNGLLNGSPHLMHIHAEGLGRCPPASAARLHNGHLAISTGDGLKYYGPPVVSLTTTGDTSAQSNLAFPRYPSVGAIRYKRVIRIPPEVVKLIRGGNGVVVIHGIDYDHSGTYDEALGASDMASQFTGDSTAPALCGHLAGTQAPV